MQISSGIEFAPVDLGTKIIPLGQIKRVSTLSESLQKNMEAITCVRLEDGEEVYSQMTAESVCRAMWNTITMFTRT